MQLLWGYDDDEGSLFLSGPIVKHFQAKKLQNFLWFRCLSPITPKKAQDFTPKKAHPSVISHILSYRM